MVTWSPNDGGSSSNDVDLATRLDEKLHSDTHQLSRLAKLAVAFSPPPTQLALQDIEHVGVVCVDEHHIELEAVICEDEGCLTVLVPLSYPTTCDDVNNEGIPMEECVLANIDSLSEDAEVRISNYEEEEEGGGASKLNRESSASFGILESDKSIDAKNVVFDVETKGTQWEGSCPEWWQSVGFYEEALRTECDTLKRTLNEEDFEDDVISLIERGLFESNLDVSDQCDVIKGVVTEVGPAGILFRAKCILMKSIDYSTGDVQEEVVIVEVPFRFGHVHNSADSLRAAVLGAVASTTEEYYNS